MLLTNSSVRESQSGKGGTSFDIDKAEEGLRHFAAEQGIKFSAEDFSHLSGNNLRPSQELSEDELSKLIKALAEDDRNELS